MSYINSINSGFMNFNYSNTQNKSNSIYDMSGLFGDYASIKSGSYGKLLKAYYSATDDGTSNRLSSMIKGNESNKEQKELLALKPDADLLYKSSVDLYTRGSKSLFNKVEVEIKDPDTGDITKTKDYDRNAIYDGVKSFISDYNKIIDSASASDNQNILRKTLYMTNQTKTFSHTLEKAGIKIGHDNKLSIDEDKFGKTNMEDVKNLFNGNSSLAYRTGRAASEIGRQILRDNTYSQKGLYNTNNYFASSFNMYL